jgi:hypothetical protein
VFVATHARGHRRRRISQRLLSQECEGIVARVQGKRRGGKHKRFIIFFLEPVKLICRSFRLVLVLWRERAIADFFLRFLSFSVLRESGTHTHARTHTHTRIEKMAGGEEVGTGAVGVPRLGNTISTVLVVIAMQAEAMPLVQTLQLTEEDEPSVFPKAVPWKKYSGTHEGLSVHIVVPGKDFNLGVDSVGTVPVSILTYASIVSLHPDLIINAGTAGGFQVSRCYLHCQTLCG